MSAPIPVSAKCLGWEERVDQPDKPSCHTAVLASTNCIPISSRFAAVAIPWLCRTAAGVIGLRFPGQLAQNVGTPQALCWLMGGLFIVPRPLELPACPVTCFFSQSQH